MLVMEELMRQYNSVPSSELRNLSQLLVDVMVSSCLLGTLSGSVEDLDPVRSGKLFGSVPDL
jgi:hypothetical protein